MRCCMPQLQEEGSLQSRLLGKGGRKGGKGLKGRKGRGQGDKGAAANVAEAEDSDDGVWAVADKEREFGDWELLMIAKATGHS